MKILWGLGLSLVLAVPALFLGRTIPVVGGPVFGILLGMLAAFWKRPERFEAGIKYTSKKVLQGAIVLLGFEMNLFNVLEVGGESLFVMVFTLAAAFLTAWLVSRVLVLRGNTPVLIGVGTAICGGSAIAAAAPVIEADDKEVAYSISTIFLFNVAAVFLFPAAGHLLAMTDTGFGMWAGTAINDTSSVVAAAYSFSAPAGAYATIVNLTRPLLIVPVTLVLAFVTARRRPGKEGGFRPAKVFPWFVLGFLLASVVCTLEVVPREFESALVRAGKFLIITAMASIGLNTDIRKLLGNGRKPILLGLSCWAAVACTSLLVQRIAGGW